MNLAHQGHPPRVVPLRAHLPGAGAADDGRPRDDRHLQRAGGGGAGGGEGPASRYLGGGGRNQGTLRGGLQHSRGDTRCRGAYAGGKRGGCHHLPDGRGQPWRPHTQALRHRFRTRASRRPAEDRRWPGHQRQPFRASGGPEDGPDARTRRSCSGGTDSAWWASSRAP